MAFARYLTLAWPGMPWLWLRGSRMGLVLSLAFAVAVDVGLVTTYIWPDLAEHGFVISLWVATASIWLVSTVSAVAAFPPAIASHRPAEADALFIRARDAYLERNWLAAEAWLRELLELAPTDGEAQLLWGTMLRRLGRDAEARAALAKLSRSDAGARWSAAISRELALLDGSAGQGEPTILSLQGPPPGTARDAA